MPRILVLAPTSALSQAPSRIVMLVVPSQVKDWSLQFRPMMHDSPDHFLALLGSLLIRIPIHSVRRQHLPRRMKSTRLSMQTLMMADGEDAVCVSPTAVLFLDLMVFEEFRGKLADGLRHKHQRKIATRATLLPSAFHQEQHPLSPTMAVISNCFVVSYIHISSFYNHTWTCISHSLRYLMITSTSLSFSLCASLDNFYWTTLTFHYIFRGLW